MTLNALKDDYVPFFSCHRDPSQRSGPVREQMSVSALETIVEFVFQDLRFLKAAITAKKVRELVAANVSWEIKAGN